MAKVAKAGWTDDDTAFMESLATSYRESGLPQKDAYDAALDDMIEANTSERTRFIERVMGEQAPEVKAA